MKMPTKPYTITTICFIKMFGLKLEVFYVQQSGKKLIQKRNRIARLGRCRGQIPCLCLRISEKYLRIQTLELNFFHYTQYYSPINLKSLLLMPISYRRHGIPVRLRTYFLPIVANYSKWIESQKQILDEKRDSGDVNDRLKSIGDKNLQECIVTNKRIHNGIDFLKSNERARTAFCFMNAVMNDKRTNEEGESLNWREFQMAFILQSLRGVSGESKDEQSLIDVLWFPTGGGKTEAYLGIVIFAMAYRRLMADNETSQ